MGSTTTSANGNWSLVARLPRGRRRPRRDRCRLLRCRGTDAEPSGDPDRQRWQPVHRVGLDRVVRPRQRHACDRITARSTPSLSSVALLPDRGATETLNGNPLSDSLTDFCSTQTDIATVTTPTIGAGDQETRGLERQPGVRGSEPVRRRRTCEGGLVNITVPVGEADSVSQFVNPMPFFSPGGFPSCTADLEGADGELHWAGSRRRATRSQTGPSTLARPRTTPGAPPARWRLRAATASHCRTGRGCSRRSTSRT